MEIRTIWQNGQYPSFNIELATTQGGDAFMVLKGCQIKNGPNGPFISVPSKKNEQTGKYWNHAYLSEQFAAVVLAKAEAAQSAPQRPAPDKAGQWKAAAPKAPQRQAAPTEDDSDIPF